MFKECLPKVGIKIQKYLMSEYYSLFPYFLQSLLNFLNFKFLNILVLYQISCILLVL